jgi:hypothetical protein
VRARYVRAEILGEWRQLEATVTIFGEHTDTRQNAQEPAQRGRVCADSVRELVGGLPSVSKKVGESEGRGDMECLGDPETVDHEPERVGRWKGE